MLLANKLCWVLIILNFLTTSIAEQQRGNRFVSFHLLNDGPSCSCECTPKTDRRVDDARAPGDDCEASTLGCPGVESTSKDMLKNSVKESLVISGKCIGTVNHILKEFCTTTTMSEFVASGRKTKIEVDIWICTLNATLVFINTTNEIDQTYCTTSPQKNCTFTNSATRTTKPMSGTWLLSYTKYQNTSKTTPFRAKFGQRLDPVASSVTPAQAASGHETTRIKSNQLSVGVSNERASQTSFPLFVTIGLVLSILILCAILLAIFYQVNMKQSDRFYVTEASVARETNDTILLTPLRKKTLDFGQEPMPTDHQSETSVTEMQT